MQFIFYKSLGVMLVVLSAKNVNLSINQTLQAHMKTVFFCYKTLSDPHFNQEMQRCKTKSHSALALIIIISEHKKCVYSQSEQSLVTDQEMLWQEKLLTTPEACQLGICFDK